MLSRGLAEQGHYPAIDVEQSISRVMHAIARPEDLAAARLLKQLYSRLQKSRDLIAVGAYVPGCDPMLDQAIALQAPMNALLQQDLNERASFAASSAQLKSLFTGYHAAPE